MRATKLFIKLWPEKFYFALPNSTRTALNPVSATGRHPQRMLLQLCPCQRTRALGLCGGGSLGNGLASQLAAPGSPGGLGHSLQQCRESSTQ